MHSTSYGPPVCEVDWPYSCLQLEQAGIEEFAKARIVDEDGTEQEVAGLQVVLYSSQHFGPENMRALTVRLLPLG
jgi:hypothetical protein